MTAPMAITPSPVTGGGPTRASASGPDGLVVGSVRREAVGNSGRLAPLRNTKMNFVRFRFDSPKGERNPALSAPQTPKLLFKAAILPSLTPTGFAWFEIDQNCEWGYIPPCRTLTGCRGLISMQLLTVSRINRPHGVRGLKYPRCWRGCSVIVAPLTGCVIEKSIKCPAAAER